MKGFMKDGGKRSRPVIESLCKHLRYNDARKLRKTCWRGVFTSRQIAEETRMSIRTVTDMGSVHRILRAGRNRNWVGVCSRMMDGLAAEAAFPTAVMIDAMELKVHRTATGSRSKKGNPVTKGTG